MIFRTFFLLFTASVWSRPAFGHGRLGHPQSLEYSHNYQNTPHSSAAFSASFLGRDQQYHRVPDPPMRRQTPNTSPRVMNPDVSSFQPTHPREYINQSQPQAQSVIPNQSQTFNPAPPQLIYPQAMQQRMPLNSLPYPPTPAPPLSQVHHHPQAYLLPQHQNQVHLQPQVWGIHPVGN